MPLYKKIIGLLIDTLGAWQEDKGSRLAAALAYYTVFSITPLLIIIISITGLVFGERAAHDEIAHQLAGLVGSEAAELIQTMLANFQNPTSGIVTSLIGLVTMLYGATGLFYQVQSALNTIWHAETPNGNGFVYQLKQRFIHLALIIGVGAFLLIILFSEIAFTAIAEYLKVENLPQTQSFLIYVFIITLLFAVLYKILPEVKTAWRDIILGAAVTSLLFNVGRFLIGVYMRLSNVGSAYGTAGSLVILLVWVYYSAQIFLLGAEFTYVYARTYGSHSVPNNQHKVPAELDDDTHLEILAKTDPQDNVEYGTTQYIAAAGDLASPINDPLSKDETPPATTPLPETPERTGLSKKMVTTTTIIGTLIASVLSLTWLHRKRQRKETAKSEAND